MTAEDRVAKIRGFLNREDLEGTDLKLKERVLNVDSELTKAQAESQTLVKQLQQDQEAANNKGLEVMGLSERLQGLCDLVVDLVDTPELETEE